MKAARYLVLGVLAVAFLGLLVIAALAVVQLPLDMVRSDG